MAQKKLLKKFTIELAGWYLLPALFLVYYIAVFAMPLQVIGQHLYIVTLGLIGFLSLRILLFRVIAHAKWYKYISIFLLASILFTLILYYALAVFGLDSWNKVISKELFVIYLQQSQHMAESLEVSLWGVIIGIIFFYISCLLLAKYYVAKLDIAPKLSSVMTVSTPLYLLMLAATVLAAPFQMYQNSDTGNSFEPFTISFLASRATFKLQDNHIDPVLAKKLDNEAVALRQSYQPANLAQPKNLIFIVVDALRYDKLNINGYKKNLSTPFLNKLHAANKIRNAGILRATCGESACGMQSLISSQYVSQFSYQPFTLHDVMRKNGYQIHMLIGGDHTNFYGMRKLYGQVNSYFDGSMAQGYYMNNDAFVLQRTKLLPNFANSSKQKPVMLQYHLMSAHTLGEKHVQYKKFTPANNYRIDKTSVADLDKYTNYYDNGVIQADAYLEQILNLLDKKGYLDNAVIAITADHGESIGEHGKFRHANSVYEQLLKIPFILIDWQGTNGMAINKSTLSSQVDVAPTILHELGMPIPNLWQGKPLQLGNSRQISYFQQNTDAGLYDISYPPHVYKYWVNTTSSEEFVFDLYKDPAESNNIVKTQPKSRLQAWRNKTGDARSTAVISIKEQ